MSDDVKKQWEKQNFDTDLGQKAHVTRESLPDSEMIDSCNECLRDMGESLGRQDPAIKHMTYLGSAAVHVFASEVLVGRDGALPQLAFYSQTDTLGKTNELIAGAAGQDLLKSIAKRYGRKPPTKRSGF